MKGLLAAATVAACALLGSAAVAQVPPDVAAFNKAHPGVDPGIGPFYAPLFPKEPYPGVTVVRDQAYGSDPLQKLDVYAPEKPGKGREVVLFIHGGGFVRGDKHGAFYPDNITLWAAQNGMVGVNINYRLAPQNPWPAGARDLASAIAWTRANIARYGGDPNRIVIWGHSAGANHVADYVAHPEVRGEEFKSVKGAVILSAFYANHATGSPAHAYYGSDGVLQSAEDSLARLTKSPIPLFVAGAEFDPDFFRTYEAFLHEGLCKAGRCPAWDYLKGHGHLSEGMSVGTPDKSLSGPLLTWIKARR